MDTKIESCVVCQSKDFAHLFKVGQFENFSCKSCQLQFLNPQPSNERLREIYSEHYFLPVDSAETDYLKRQTAKMYMDVLKKSVPELPGKQLLEIGCGKGNFLLEAQACGMDISGIEFSQFSVDEANEKLKGKFVSAGEIYDFNFGDRRFDVIVASDVIEHVRNPALFVEHVVKVLKPGGVFYCTTPSLTSWSAKLMGKNWVEYKEEHLYYFAPDSIFRLFKNAGFKNLTVQSNIKLLNLNYIFAHFERYKIPGWTSILGVCAKILPQAILKRPFPIEASGMTVIASVN